MFKMPKNKAAPKPIKEQLREAHENLVEKVSVAGWREAFGEKIIWIRRNFQVALLILSGCCLYYAYRVINAYATSGYKDEVTFVPNSDHLPFPNVTICAPVYLNQTFIQNNLTVPPKMIELYLKGSDNNTLDGFYSEVTLLLSIVTRHRDLNPVIPALFHKLMAENPQIQDFSQFASDASPPCAAILKSCWFDNQQFNCCDFAVQSFGDDGICYLLKLNSDSDNAAHSELTFQQRQPGPNGGLTVEADLSLQDFPWLDTEIGNGYKVYAAPTPYEGVQSPLGAPHGAETFIKVKPELRLLSANCAGYGHLAQKEKPAIYYDPEGIDCAAQAIGSITRKYLSCEPVRYLMRPNASAVCSPLIGYGLVETTNAENTNSRARQLSLLSSESRAKKAQAEAEVDLKNIFSENTLCPKHCRRWTYKSTSSFSYLEKANQENEQVYSKLHIFYGDFEYLQHNQVKESTAYIAFCKLICVVSFYWGMSVISFFDLMFHVSRYAYVWRKARKEEPQPKRNNGRRIRRVHPIFTETEC